MVADAVNGILLLNTLDIAKEANIAHGTVFAHFPNKEMLISNIIETELKSIARNLKEMIDNQSDGIGILLGNYMNLLAQNEDFFVVIAKEFPFLNPNLQKSIISTESIIKNIIYQHIETGIKNGIYKQIDITMSLSFLFGTINYYLSRKEYFITKNDKIIMEKKQQIIDIFFEIINP